MKGGGGGKGERKEKRKGWKEKGERQTDRQTEGLRERGSDCREKKRNRKNAEGEALWTILGCRGYKEDISPRYRWVMSAHNPNTPFHFCRWKFTTKFSFKFSTNL